MKTRKKIANATACVRRSCPVAETVINNEDLLTEILLRLPAKPLIKFQSVSKKWFSLISDAKFSALHTLRNPNCVGSALILSNLDLFTLSHPKSSGHSKLSFLSNAQTEYGLVIVDSCNGLLLCKCSIIGRIYKSYFYVVCNPTTRKHRLLPECEYSRNKVHASLVFDPSKSPHYLVVEAIFEIGRGPRAFVFDIYQSEFGKWAGPIKLDLPSEWGNIGGVKSFWNCSIHWISECGYHIWFDPYSKELTGIKLPVPPRILPPSCIEYFGGCDGRLFLIQTRKKTAPGFRVLEMHGDYCSWRATYRVNLRGLMKDVPGLDEILKKFGFSVMSVVKGDRSLDLSLVIAIRHKTFSYGLQRKKWFVLDDLSDSFRSYPFIFSLAPV